MWIIAYMCTNFADLTSVSLLFSLFFLKNQQIDLLIGVPLRQFAKVESTALKVGSVAYVCLYVLTLNLHRLWENNMGS